MSASGSTTPWRRIAVFRALMLGDMLCATPALRALRRGFPEAHITLVGLPWAQSLVQRLPEVDAFLPCPGYPGLPEIACDVHAIPHVLARLQAEHFDLAVQLHGSGGIVNPLVSLFGARQTAGFYDDHAWVPPVDTARYLRWPATGHEIHRLLALTRHLGAPDCGSDLSFPIGPQDRTALARQWPGVDAARPYVCLHAGSQWPSRRWPLARFAAIGDALAECGHTVVLTGSANEGALVEALQHQMRAPAVNLAGQTTLWTLGALLAESVLLVSNDTSVSHIASALGVNSVVISSGSDVQRWSPLDVSRHRVIWHPIACRPCAHAICPYDDACAKAIDTAQVLAAVQAALLSRSGEGRVWT